VIRPWHEVLRRAGCFDDAFFGSVRPDKPVSGLCGKVNKNLAGCTRCLPGKRAGC